MTLLNIDLESLRIYGTVPCGVPEYPFFDIDESDCPHFHKYVKCHPRLTYPIVAKGNSMIDAGINDGDVVFIDSSKDYFQDGKIAFVEHNGNRTLKRLHLRVTTHSQRVELISENPRYQPILVQESDSFRVIGTLAGVFKGAE
jgi:DNA polymerase V